MNCDGFGFQDRARYELLIGKLGGSVSDKPTFDPSATHLVCNKPARNEKLLASIASGKWVLHKSFLDACKEEGRFVEVSASKCLSKSPVLTKIVNVTLLAHRCHSQDYLPPYYSRFSHPAPFFLYLMFYRFIRLQIRWGKKLYQQVHYYIRHLCVQ